MNETYNEKTPLSLLGWDCHFQRYLKDIHMIGGAKDSARNDTFTPARVMGVQKNHFLINRGQGDELARPRGRMTRRTGDIFPVIGDWVLARDGIIRDVLPRKSILSRGAAGSRGSQEGPWGNEQIIAANLDTVFIVSGMDRDFNLRRIERYLTLVYNCGISPVIILTKADLHDDPVAFIRQVEKIAPGVPVHPLSADEDAGLISLAPYISEGRTTAMIGSSGAGKSTLVNRLYGEDIQPTADVSCLLGKGRHTTTSRSLIMLPEGGMIVDNPGIREVGLGEAGSGIDAAFPDVEQLARDCRFSDCSHTREPGCRVKEAVELGVISQDRLENYRKMKREMDYLSERQKKSADRIEKERWKGVSIKIRSVKKGKNHR